MNQDEFENLRDRLEAMKREAQVKERLSRSLRRAYMVYFAKHGGKNQKLKGGWLRHKLRVRAMKKITIRILLHAEKIGYIDIAQVNRMNWDVVKPNIK